MRVSHAARRTRRHEKAGDVANDGEEHPIVLRELESVDSFSLSPDDYRDWTIPALLVLGGESPPQYRATIEALGAALPGSHIAVLEGQQHSAIRTAPSLFAKTILKFLKSRTKAKRKRH